ncbi:hypothetical protein HN587_05120 [Candidatus Woesearchaeota archaeon]|jgi:hypothetical protein|nr:hypothetical protein [Candidatus Woesearchaeota archaeon]
MKDVSTYLVCKEHILEVKEFLKQFFEEEKGRYNHKEWITFKLLNSDFKICLMTGDNQPITQNITFEINCKSLEELKNYAHKFNKKIENFLATATEKPYRFYFIEIQGPNGICKIDISCCEEEPKTN